MNKLWRDQYGVAVSTELMLIGTVLIFGLIAALTTVRDAVVSEISDVSGSLQDINQSYVVNGATSGASATAGFGFDDASDIADSADDAAGMADNGITFDGRPLEELGTTFSASVVSALSNISVVTGNNGSATGTIGDGTTSTTFNTTTDGNISGMVGNEVRFRESPGTAGTFTTVFDDAIADLEFWVRNLADTGTPSLLGNFTITLNDGTVIENAPFTVIPDNIQRNSSYGLFNTLNTDRERVSVVTLGGNQYLSDPTSTPGSFTSQAAGRITFDDLPAFSGTADVNTIGISSISFDRFGGAGGFQAAFSFSGIAIVPD